MPRTPQAVFVIVDNPNQRITTTPGTPLTSLQCWLEPIQTGETVDQVVNRVYKAHPIGSKVYAVDDTKVRVFNVGASLNEEIPVAAKKKAKNA